VSKAAGIFLGIFLAVGMAQAQIPTSGNIFVGYSFSQAEPSPNVNLNGWEASLEGKFLPWIGLVGDFGATYGSTSVTFPCPPNFLSCGTFTGDVKRYTYLFGPRVSVPVGRFTPFAQFLVGASHINSFGDTDTSFATAVGGGLDYRLIHGLALRLQGDEIHTNFFDTGENHFRFSTGIDFRF
jgi:hypothetical protein